MAVDMTTPAATILIVDDEPLNRGLLEALLRPEGYRTRTATNGREALAAVAECAPDLILLDVMMPEMDGHEVTVRLKANPLTCNIPVILVTADAERSARLAGLQAGAEEFLTKPIDKTELYLRIRNLLRLKAYGDLLRDHGEQLAQEVEARTADLGRFRKAMDANDDAIFLLNRTTMAFVEVNQTASDLFGYPNGELLEQGPRILGMSSTKSLESLFDSVIEGCRANERMEMTVQHRNGQQIPVELHMQAVRSGVDWIIVGVLRDVTLRHAVEKRLHHLAHYDELTGLPNRTLFRETLQRTLGQAVDGGWSVAVMFVDIDRFKDVNDKCGHDVGDELLRQVGARLTGCVRVRDTVGRLGGDEFGLILAMQDGQRGAAVAADKIRTTMRRPFSIGGHLVETSASIGITICPDDALDSETLIKYADTAMYRAKQAGRNTFRFFTPQMNTDVVERLDLEAALRDAIQNEEFVLHYQPKMHVETGRVTGAEALLRWERPGHGLVMPDAFIPALEETGLIVEVGNWVIAAACKQVGQWSGTEVGPIQVSVNVSGRQLLEGRIDEVIGRELQANGIPGSLLEVELTESTLMANTDHTIATLRDLRERGVEISIDDFGTGFSSLAYLCRFPVDKLKIDIAFIRNVTTNADDAAIASAIILMAHSLKLKVVAEGVETEDQLDYLRAENCDQIQGYHFSRPLTAAQLEELVEPHSQGVAVLTPA
jgi:diguanylate cyclase (GGDEF)-like protein/PAS domain S-box-containing protein